MKRIGMITVARWMAESLPNDMIAYMEYDGTLFRLDRIRCYNGYIRPIFETPWYRASGFPYGEMQLRQQYTPESPVFLSMGENLVGVALENVAESVEGCQVGCWALRDKPICAVTRAKESETQEAWESSWKCATSIPVESWYG